MPRSRKREHHHTFVPPPHTVQGKKNHAIIYVAVIFFALMGTGIAYFAAGPFYSWMVAGGIGGGIAGFFFGSQIDKVITKKIK